jgi:hypothetical protein
MILTASCNSIEPQGIKLHESLLPNREVETVSQGMKKSEATYLFGVSLSSVNRYARGWSLSSSTKGKDNGAESMNVVMLFNRTNLPYGVKTHPWHLRPNRLTKPL